MNTKRLISVIVIVVFTCLLSGCGDIATDITTPSDKDISSVNATVTQEDVFEKAESYTKSQISSKESSRSEISGKISESKTPEATVSHADNKESTNSAEVYVTPTGKRYHLDPDCGGKNSRPATLQQALSRGLTPCKKCAQ